MSELGDEWREKGQGPTMASAREQAQARLRTEGHDVPDEELRYVHTSGVDRAFVRLQPEETHVDRLTLLSSLHHLYFDPPIFLRSGEAFWTWGRTLHIRGLDGQVRQVQPRPSRPTDLR